MDVPLLWLGIVAAIVLPVFSGLLWSYHRFFRFLLVLFTLLFLVTGVTALILSVVKRKEEQKFKVEYDLPASVGKHRVWIDPISDISMEMLLVANEPVESLTRREIERFEWTLQGCWYPQWYEFEQRSDRIPGANPLVCVRFRKGSNPVLLVYTVREDNAAKLASRKLVVRHDVFALYRLPRNRGEGFLEGVLLGWGILCGLIVLLAFARHRRAQARAQGD